MMNDVINHPAHYTDGKYEVIDFIEQYKLPFHLGNTVKYICRAGKKDPAKTVEDLRKALWYLKRFYEDVRKYEVYAKATKDLLREIDFANDNSIFNPSIKAEDFAQDKQLSDRLKFIICSIRDWCIQIMSGDDIMSYCTIASMQLLLEDEIEERSND